MPLTTLTAGPLSGKHTEMSFQLSPIAIQNLFPHTGKGNVLGHCSSPCLSWQGHIFPENCMKQLKGLWFQLGSDPVLRHGFSLTEEMNEVDKS